VRRNSTQEPGEEPEEEKRGKTIMNVIVIALVRRSWTKGVSEGGRDTEENEGDVAI
jgi:hypothetical protein